MDLPVYGLFAPKVVDNGGKGWWLDAWNDLVLVTTRCILLRPIAAQRNATDRFATPMQLTAPQKHCIAPIVLTLHRRRTNRLGRLLRDDILV
jgi:hypothetical protein